MKFRHILVEKLKERKIKRQLYTIYFIAVLIPIIILGCILLFGNKKRMTDYCRDLLKADNVRIQTSITEITTQVYTQSEEIAKDAALIQLLSFQYYIRDNFNKAYSNVSVINNAIASPDISQVTIYMNNRHFFEDDFYKYATADIRNSSWYERACTEKKVFWESIDGRLCLVRRIELNFPRNEAVLVIRVSDTYLNKRIQLSDCATKIFVDGSDVPVFAAGQMGTFNANYEFLEQHDGQFATLYDQNHKNMSYTESISLYNTESKIYIINFDDTAYVSIIRTLQISFLLIALVLAIPFLIISVFTEYFTKRVEELRDAMHKASNDDYELIYDISGGDEISVAFSDLTVMVAKIKEKDAMMYEAAIKETKLLNEQQAMEFKMLASQINPHFLYNTLESIRMKAFTAGDKEVAQAIKLLGKSLRYVLDNTGTHFTKLANELDHVETYFSIQKIRFEGKFESEIEVTDDVYPEKIKMLPLLLQPLAENAIVHGLEEKEHDGKVTVFVTRNEQYLTISVMDNGSGMDAKTLENLRKRMEEKDQNDMASIGLYNINQRLRLAYGNDYSLNIDSAVGAGTVVRIDILLEKMY